MRVLTVFAVFLFWMIGLANSANLYPDQVIYKGQSLSSDDGRYQLVMQHDGNLVYYRTSDWSARWHISTQNRGGHLAVMQRDGNFVVYDIYWNALWHTGTYGRPGAYIAAQTDGNLVIYQNGQPLWNIGVDTMVQDPKYRADVVGRNMENNMPYAWLGHIGLYDGLGGVYEVLNDGKPNAVAYNTLINSSSGPTTDTGERPLRRSLITLLPAASQTIAARHLIKPSMPDLEWHYAHFKSSQLCGIYAFCSICARDAPISRSLHAPGYISMRHLYIEHL